MTRDEILDFLKSHKDELRRLYGVEEIALFGSYARQTARPESDIDIVVELAEEKKTLSNFFSLSRYLEERLGGHVDLGMAGAIKPAVKKAVMKDMIHV